MRARFAILALATLSLAACAASGERARSTSTQDPSTQAASDRGARASAPQRRTYAVADLMDADTTKVDVILGPPDIVRQEGAGEMRIYRNSACVVHVFLYPRAGRLSAVHVEARSDATRLNERDAGSCISSFS